MFPVSQKYTLEGQLYIPGDKKPVIIKGHFKQWQSSEIRGSMRYEGSSKFKIYGALVDTELFCFPDAEKNPQSILILEHYGENNIFNWFYLHKQGNKPTGQYTGKLDPSDTPAAGIQALPHIIDGMHPQAFQTVISREEYYNVEIYISKKF